MWRIKALTEIYGPVGLGWRYEVTGREMKEGANGEVAAFVDINLYYKLGEMWSEAIPGTGGSMFVAKEKNGLYTSDECYKMALTDAISVSAKALGVGADVYWSGDSTKYERPTAQQKVDNAKSAKPALISQLQLDELVKLCSNPDGTKNEKTAKALKDAYTSCGFDSVKEITVDKYEKIKEATENSLLPFEV
jgi:hypothetical protein